MKKPYFVIWGLVILLLLFFWIYLPTLSRYRELKSESERLGRDIASIDKKIAALEEERELLKHDQEYLEKVIREELGLVKPGEVVYKFIEEKIQPPVTESKTNPGTPSAAAASTAKPTSNSQSTAPFVARNTR